MVEGIFARSDWNVPSELCREVAGWISEYETRSNQTRKYESSSCREAANSPESSSGKEAASGATGSHAAETHSESRVCRYGQASPETCTCGGQDAGHDSRNNCSSKINHTTEGQSGKPKTSSSAEGKHDKSEVSQYPEDKSTGETSWRAKARQHSEACSKVEC